MPAETAASTPPNRSPFVPITSQEELDRIIGQRLARVRSTTKAPRVDATDVGSLRDCLAAAAEAVAAALNELDRQHKLPPEVASE